MSSTTPRPTIRACVEEPTLPGVPEPDHAPVSLTLEDTRSARLRSLAGDPIYKALLKLDRAVARLQADVAADIGQQVEDDEDSCETLAWLSDARYALYSAAQSFASETPPRITRALGTALARARARQTTAQRLRPEDSHE